MPHAEFGPLRRLSARLGRDIEQVQASGGNTSIKSGDVMWVKASGLWLADADDDDVFVPVDRGKVLAAIDATSEQAVLASVIAGQNARGLRPSIETSMHALLDHEIVIHTHSVRTIALAIRADARQQLGQRLDGEDWAFIPYYKPGMDLTRGIASVLGHHPSGRRATILVLGNHGLVVGASTAEEAGSIIDRVERKLDAPLLAGESDVPDRAPPGSTPVADRLAQSLAVVPGLRKLALGGSYYPDHVVFLGPAAATEPGGPSKLLLTADGAFLPDDASGSAQAMASCLAHVLARLPGHAELRRLSIDEELALMDWDAEKYRQQLER